MAGSSWSSSLAMVFLVLGLLACTKGGHHGSAAAAIGNVPANVPAGSGAVNIDMTGTWEVQDLRITETNTATPKLPQLITLWMAPAYLIAIGQTRVSRPDIEALAGFTLDWYVNVADGRTLIFGYGYDRRAVGGIREQFGLAAGATGESTLLGEAYLSAQSSALSPEVMVRCRFTLVRPRQVPRRYAGGAPSFLAGDGPRPIFESF